jgi:hypothetical protein
MTPPFVPSNRTIQPGLGNRERSDRAAGAQNPALHIQYVERCLHPKPHRADIARLYRREDHRDQRKMGHKPSALLSSPSRRRHALLAKMPKRNSIRASTARSNDISVWKRFARLKRAAAPLTTTRQWENCNGRRMWVGPSLVACIWTPSRSIVITTFHSITSSARASYRP